MAPLASFNVSSFYEHIIMVFACLTIHSFIFINYLSMARKKQMNAFNGKTCPQPLMVFHCFRKHREMSIKEKSERLTE